MIKLAPQIVKYRGVVTGLRISAVNGTAFVDAVSDTNADTQIARIIADGGTVVDEGWIRTTIAVMKQQGIYASAKFIGDANMGVKKDVGTGALSKLYDISGNNNDAVQATGGKQPIWTASVQNGRYGIVFDGLDDALSLPSTDWSSQTFSIISSLDIISLNRSWLNCYSVGVDSTTKGHSFMRNSSTSNVNFAWGSNFNPAIFSPQLNQWYITSEVFGNNILNAWMNEIASVSNPVSKTDSNLDSTAIVTMGAAFNVQAYPGNIKIGTFIAFPATAITEQQRTVLTRLINSYYAIYAGYEPYVNKGYPLAYCGSQHSIEIYDSAGRFIRGVLGSVGSGEELVDVIGGTNPALLNGNFSAWTGDNPNNWIMDFVEDATNYITEATAKANFVSSSVVKFMSVQQACMGAGGLKKLWKITTIIDSITGTLKISERSVGNLATYTTPGTKIVYRNNSGSDRIAFINDTLAVNAIISGLYVQQVTAPSVSGATIVSAKGGATQSFNYKNANFAYNQSSYQVVIKKLRG